MGAEKLEKYETVRGMEQEEEFMYKNTDIYRHTGILRTVPMDTVNLKKQKTRFLLWIWVSYSETHRSCLERGQCKA